MSSETTISTMPNPSSESIDQNHIARSLSPGEVPENAVGEINHLGGEPAPPREWPIETEVGELLSPPIY